MIINIDQTEVEARYPWIEGFEAMLDATWHIESGTPVNPKAYLRAVGVWACTDGACGSSECTMSTENIQQRTGLNTDEDADSYAQGARAALSVLTEKKVEVVYV